jgi:predicted house-cleaning noncanonical NTP pyrophosphatase (MazG superfamily)
MHPSKKYDKLVRDRIPEIIRRRGGTPVFRVVDAEEYGRRLKDKLREEVEEFVAAADAAAAKEELADVLEVIAALATHLGATTAEIEAVRAKKAEERGAFKERLVLEEA